MTFEPGEVANYAVRVFLERVGRRYDAAASAGRADGLAIRRRRHDEHRIDLPFAW